MNRSLIACAAALAVSLVSSCAADHNDRVGSTSEDLSVLESGAGAGPELIHEDPCANPAGFAKQHGMNLIVAKPGDHEISGTRGRDLIVGTDGDDEIWGGDGDDVICAGYGEDVVHGGDGNDWIDGGGDNDRLFGDDGNDVIHGRGGGDFIFGGRGNDLLFGDILDDHLFGEEGDDLLIGGHGTDHLDGGPGNDYLRGDTGNDFFVGGAGTDVASFITAMPPGQPDIVGKPSSGINGVKVDFTDDCQNEDGKHDGCANGDGGNEPLDGIEIVVGSPYTDEIIGAMKVRFVGGYGDDKCDGNPCGTALPAGAANKIFVALDSHARDTGLIVTGRDAGDAIEIVMVKDDFHVLSKNGAPLFAGPGCSAAGADAVVCSPDHVLRWTAAWMAGGDDVVKLAEAATSASKTFPVDMTAHVSGGDGDDYLYGGDEQDVLFSGPTGADHLYGNKGGDALLSESRKWPRKPCTPAEAITNPRCTEDKPDAEHYTDGADELFGGPDDDQLVIDYPCGNHHYSGGGGKDVGGFARSGRFDLRAQLAGAASKVTAFHGKAYNPQLCGDKYATTLEDDIEILEAADGNDELWGNDEPNIIWGRAGDDYIHGLGSDDVLDGLLGNDWLYGGAGNDKLLGAAGNNHLFQDAE
jgi:Ca2+-binding RTX toxin-like protein